MKGAVDFLPVPEIKTISPLKFPQGKQQQQTRKKELFAILVCAIVREIEPNDVRAFCS